MSNTNTISPEAFKIARLITAVKLTLCSPKVYILCAASIGLYVAITLVIAPIPVPVETHWYDWMKIW